MSITCYLYERSHFGIVNQSQQKITLSSCQMGRFDSVMVMRFVEQELTHMSNCRSLRVNEMLAISSTLKENTFFTYDEDREMKRVARNVKHADSGGIIHSLHLKDPHTRKKELESSLPPRHNAFQKMLSDLGEYLTCGGYSECNDVSLIHTLLTILSNLHNYEQSQGVLFIIHALCLRKSTVTWKTSVVTDAGPTKHSSLTLAS